MQLHGPRPLAREPRDSTSSQDNGKLQTTLTLRRPRASTSLESILDRMPVVGGIADTPRPIVFIGAALVVLALITVPMAILTSGDTDIAASAASAPSNEVVTTSPAPVEEAVEEGDPAEPCETEKTQAEEESAPPEVYAGPVCEVAEIDENAVLGEQDQV